MEISKFHEKGQIPRVLEPGETDLKLMSVKELESIGAAS